MTQHLVKISSYIDTFTNGFGKTISWLVLLMAILMFSVVVFRYGLSTGSIALQESVLYLHALVFMGASAFTLKNDGHVRVDVLYRRMSPKLKAWVDLSGTLVFLFPVCIFITYISIRYVSSSWEILETSTEPGGLPAVFLLKSLIFVLSGTLLLQGLSETLKNILILAGESQASAHSIDTHYNG